MRLISDDGTQYGVISIDEARKISNEKGLDLVEVSPEARPPVVKLIDYGKYKYETQKKLSESKKKQVTVALKEIQFRPNIEKHDLDVKLKRAQQFLEHGDKIKMIMQFRGREIAYKKLGLGKFKRILQDVIGIGGVIESEPKFMGNRILAMISSGKKR